MNNCASCRFYKPINPESKWWAHWGECKAPIPLCVGETPMSMRVRENWEKCPAWQRNEAPEKP